MQVSEKNLKFDPHHAKIAELIVTRLCMGNFIAEPYPVHNFSTTDYMY